MSSPYYKPFGVTIAYSQYSSCLEGALTENDAREACQRLYKFYHGELSYPVTELYYERYCDTCEGAGKVRKCRHKHHAFRMESCYKPCPACKADPTTRYDMLPEVQN